MNMNEKNDEGRNKYTKEHRRSTYRSLLNMDHAISRKEKTASRVGKEKSMQANKRSSSRSSRQEKKTEADIDYDIPDKSFGDLYCKACDSHMNSESMWAVHLQGKRHLKNKKYVLDLADWKYEYIDDEPEAQADIDAETSTIVGLQHVCETQRLEQKPLYTCFICNTTMPNSQVLIEHLLGLKHRMAYLKEHDLERYNLIQESKLKKGQKEPVVEECVAKHEQEEGRGKMVIKKEKAKPTYRNSKKNCSREYHDSYSDRSEREDKDFFITKWEPIPSHSDRSKDYNYEDREMGYSEFPFSLDKHYSKKAFNKVTDNVQPYANPGSIRDDDSWYYRKSSIPGNVSSNVSPDRNYGLSANRLPLSAASESRFTDLRDFLEQKKVPSMDSNIPDEVLGIISALPTISFFQLVLFKLDNMKIEEEVEIKFLDRVVNKATTLAMSLKSKLLSPTLRMKFQESLFQNAVETKSPVRESSKEMQDLMQMVGECKAMSSLRTQNVTTYQTPPSNSVRVEPKYASHYEPPVYSTFSTTPSYESYKPSPQDQFGSFGYAHPVRNSPPQKTASYTSSYSSPSASSSSCHIPGLTLTENTENQSSEMSSPFDILQAQAMNIFGVKEWGFVNKQTSKY